MAQGQVSDDRRLTIEAVIRSNARITEVAASSCLLDRGKLESALARPFHTFGGAPLHPTIAERAAALLEGIALAHAFHDGNKRTAWLSCVVFLDINGLKVCADKISAAQLVVDLVEHKVGVQEVAQWLDNHSTIEAA